MSHLSNKYKYTHIYSIYIIISIWVASWGRRTVCIEKRGKDDKRKLNTDYCLKWKLKWNAFVNRLSTQTEYKYSKNLRV